MTPELVTKLLEDKEKFLNSIKIFREPERWKNVTSRAMVKAYEKLIKMVDDAIAKNADDISDIKKEYVRMRERVEHVFAEKDNNLKLRPGGDRYSVWEAY